MSALFDSQSNGLAVSAVKDVKDAVRTNLACLFRRFGQEFQGRHPVLPWLVKYSVAMLNRCRRGPDGSIPYRTNWWGDAGRATLCGTVICLVNFVETYCLREALVVVTRTTNEKNCFFVNQKLCVLHPKISTRERPCWFSLALFVRKRQLFFCVTGCG